MVDWVIPMVVFFIALLGASLEKHQRAQLLWLGWGLMALQFPFPELWPGYIAILPLVVVLHHVRQS